MAAELRHVTTPHLVPDRRSPPSSNEPIALAPSMIEAVSRAHAFAPAATPILLHGETGTGKTFLAEYIHRLSGRPAGFHVLSLGTITASLAPAELFGHVEGAFTGARKHRPGLVATSGAGTLLLDDAHLTPLGTQKRLLQMLDRGTYRPVGSDREHVAVCRVIIAMTDHPDVLMRKGRLLKDLRYRFGYCEIEILPLRERRAEIPLHALRALEAARLKTKVEGPRAFSERALALLCDADYPGNLRQLEGIVLSAYLLAGPLGEEIDVHHLPSDAWPTARYRRHGNSDANRLIVERALRITGGNVKKAAQLLKVSRTTIHMARGLVQRTVTKQLFCLAAHVIACLAW